MWEVTNNLTFANENFPYWCRFNATRLYFNVTDLDFCICNATIAADSDIAGVGVSKHPIGTLC